MTSATMETWQRRMTLMLSLSFVMSISAVQGELLINEVAPRGSSNACNGQDWVELWNPDSSPVDMTGWILADDKGWKAEDAEPFRFPENYIIEAGAYELLCTGGGGDAPETTSTSTMAPTTTGNTTSVTSSSILSPVFSIGNNDQITLLKPDGSYATIGPFPGNDIPDTTYALDPVSLTYYNYTSTPTPGAANVMTAIPTQLEVIQQKKQKLAAQNDAGIPFFNFDRQGMSVENGFDPIVELKITMAENDYNSLMENPQYQEYYEFQSASVVTEDGVELAVLDDPGRIRTRGHEEVYMAACLGSPLPFRLDFDETNETQTLFGAPKILLRHPVDDPSHMREWVYPRMLARFGLPHARTRMVDFYINDNLVGFYTLMEIPEAEYVFARNFPNYDPTNFALFQIDPLTQGCGLYTQDQVSAGLNRVDEFSTPPYAYERGDHIPPVPMLGSDKMNECKSAWDDYHSDVLIQDVVLAYIRHDEDCVDTLLDEGLVEQELGTDNWGKEVKTFVQDYMSYNRCDPGCANSELGNDVDVQNFLKTIAFLAVTLTNESPLGNVNNFYLVQEESEAEKWKLLTYDFRKPGSPSCNAAICEERLIHWSIIRPTCESLESNSLVGPLLLNRTATTEYLGYVQEFLDTVYTDASFVEEIQNHASAIQATVEASFGGSAGSFASELTPDAATWDAGGFPLLPTMKARAADVQSQLKALEEGTFPRGTQQASGKENEPWEICVDWQSAEPNATACVEGCRYDYCHMTEWTIESFCDEATGKCLHGEEDQSCLGITDGDNYTGMVSRGDEVTYCRFAAGSPVKASECLAPGVVSNVSLSSGSSDSTTSSGSRWCVDGKTLFEAFLLWTPMFITGFSSCFY